MAALRCRFALHSPDGEPPHIDLFVDTGADTLPTYGIESGSPMYIIEELRRHRILYIVPDRASGGFCVGAFRKNDHRRVYMKHEGPVHDSGMLETICVADLIGELSDHFFLTDAPEKL